MREAIQINPKGETRSPYTYVFSVLQYTSTTNHAWFIWLALEQEYLLCAYNKYVVTYLDTR